MEQKYIMAIDQGTTGSTVLILDVSEPKSPKIIGKKTVDFKQFYPKAGWVEHDLDEIWASVLKAKKAAISEAFGVQNDKLSQIIAIGITNQRETTCIFERATGKPLSKAIVWQDKRSQNICARLKPQEELFKEKTGLVLDPYFSGTKLTWLLENSPDLKTQLVNGKAVFGTIDTFLLHRLTGGKEFATEPSNASRTLLFNIQEGKFDAQLSEILGVTHSEILPEVKDSAGVFGKTKGVEGLPDGIPISGILGDQQAALAGQTCFSEGEAKCTYGTGAFMLLNTGSTPKKSHHGLLTTVAWSINNKLTYALEGSSFIAGAAVQFLRDQINFLEHAADSEKLATNDAAAPELYFVPALAGLGAPYWNPQAKGAFFGLTRGTSKAELIRAALEGIAFSVADLYQAMSRDFPSNSKSFKVDGGAAANNKLMQFQSDILRLPIDRPRNLETTALGAALFAGLGIGLYSSLEELRGARHTDQVFTPKVSNELHMLQIQGWQRAIKAVQVFAGDDSAS